MGESSDVPHPDRDLLALMAAVFCAADSEGNMDDAVWSARNLLDAVDDSLLDTTRPDTAPRLREVGE